jgi:hypothetical protein
MINGSCILSVDKNIEKLNNNKILISPASPHISHTMRNDDYHSKHACERFVNTTYRKVQGDVSAKHPEFHCKIEFILYFVN